MHRVLAIVRLLLVVVASLLAVAALAVAGAKAWLHTDRGQAWLAAQISGRIDAGIAGRVELDRVDWRGWRTLRARGVRVFRPDGSLATAADLVELVFDLGSLRTQTVVIDSATAEGVRGTLDEGPDGRLGLTRAFEPREPPPPGPAAREAGNRDVVLRRVRLQLGCVRYGKAGDARAQLAVDSGLLDGSLRVRGDGVTDFSAEAQVALQAPAVGPASAEISGTVEQGSLKLQRFAAALPGGIRVEAAPQTALGIDPAHLLASLAPVPSAVAVAAPPAPTAGGPGGSGGARAGGVLDGLRVHVAVPADGLVPWGGPVLQGPVRIDARMRQRGERIEFRAQAHPRGPGGIFARGWAQPGKPGAFAATVQLRGIDPAQVLADAPRGALWMTVAAQGALAFPPNADVRADVQLGNSVLHGQPLGPGRSAIEVHGEAWRARGLDLAVPGGRLRGDLDYVRGGDGLTGAIALDADDLGAIERAVSAYAPGLSLPAARGALAVSARIAGPPGDRRFELRARSEELTVESQRVRALRASASVRGPEVRAEVRAELARGPVALRVAARREGSRAALLRRLTIAWRDARWRLTAPARVGWADGRIRLRGVELAGPGRVRVDATVPDPRRRPDGALAVRAEVDRLPLASIEDALGSGGGPPPLAGVVTGTAELRGTLRAPRGKVVVKLEAPSYRGAALRRMEATVEIAPGRAEVAATFLGAQTGSAVLTATVERAARDARAEAPPWSLDAWRGARTEATLTVRQLDLARLAAAGLIPWDAGGVVDAELTARGPLAEPELAGSVQLTAVTLTQSRVGPLPPVDARLSFESRAGRLVGDLTAVTRGLPEAKAHVELGRSLVEVIRAADRGATPVRARVSVGPGPMQLRAAQVSAGCGEVVGRVEGTLGEPRFEARARLERLVAQQLELGDLSLAAAGSPEAGLNAELAVAPRGNGGPLRASFALAGAGGRSWQLAIEAHQTPLDFLVALPAVLELKGGVLDGKLVARGERGAAARGAAVVEGALSLRADQLTAVQVGTLRQVALDLEASAGTLRIRKASAQAQGGRIDAAGAVQWTGEVLLTDLTLDLARFPLPAPARPLGELTSTVRIQLVERAGELSGEVQLSSGELVLPELRPGGRLHPLGLPNDIEIHEAGVAPPPPRPSALAKLVAQTPVSLRIVVPTGFTVRAPEANVAVEMRAVARVVDGTPALTGDLHVTSGTLVLVGRRFQVDRLALLFTGTPGFDPGIDGQLSFQQSDVSITAQVTGTVRKPELRLQSDPPMDPSQIALLVAGGSSGAGPVAGGSSGAAGTAAGAADVALSSGLSVLAGQIGSAFGGALPIDVFDVQIGPRGEAERIEAGTYLTPRLFVAFVRNLFAGPGENFNEVVAEYQLRRSLQLRTRYGDRESGGVSLLWEKRFRSTAQKQQH